MSNDGVSPVSRSGWFAAGRPGTPPVHPVAPAFATTPAAPSYAAAPGIEIHSATGRSALRLLYAATGVLAVIAIVIVVTSGSSATTAGTPYPSTVAQQFMASCEGGAPTAWSQATAGSYCTAAFSCLEAHLSYAQFIAFDQSVLDGNADPYAAEVQLCIASALKSTPAAGGSGTL
jgi:hypothetical protein